MATTVRRVKQEDRLRRQSQMGQDEDSPCKAVSPGPPPPPPSKPPPCSDSEFEPTTHQQQQQSQQQLLRKQQQQRASEAVGWTSTKQQPEPSSSRMPPLYGEEQQQQSAGLQTHSSKFPIEREVVLSLGEKNSKIPILHEYKQRSAAGSRAAIAPDAPVKQQAWVHEVAQVQESRQDTRRLLYQSSDIYSTPSGASSTTKTTRLDEEKTKSLSRTYHTIKDMISSRFGPSRKESGEPENEAAASLNNVADELRRSSKSINEEEAAKRQDGVYAKAAQAAVNMQQYPKNSYGQYGQSYSYQPNQQQSVPLPGQLQQQSSGGQLAANLPSGQGAQLHVTHHAAPIASVHQTAYAQPTTVLQSPGSRTEYAVQSAAQAVQQHHVAPTGHNQNIPMKHPQTSALMQQQAGPNCQSPQQMMHQQQQQSPRFAQQHAQNMHQRQLLQQMQQQQHSVGLPSAPMRQPQQHFNGGGGPVSNYQQYQQSSRQSMSRSQIDLPSTSRQQQQQEPRQQEQQAYYHYNRARGARFYGRGDGPLLQQQQEGEFQRRNSGKGIEKALSQPQLSYDDEADERNETEGKYEVAVSDEQFARRPETSFGVRSDGAPDGQEAAPSVSVQRRIEEIRRKSAPGEAEPVADEEAKFGRPLVGKERARDEPVENGVARLKVQQQQGSGSDYDKTGQSSSNVDSGRGSAVYSSGRRLPPDNAARVQGQDAEWVDIVESELRSILEPKDLPAAAHSTLSDSVSSVTPPLPPLTPQESPRTSRSRFSASLPYGVKPNYGEYIKSSDKRNCPSASKHRSTSSSKKDASKKFSHLFGVETGDITSTTTGLDLDSMLDRSDSDLSTNDARTIRKQLEGLENMYSEVLKLLGGNTKKRRKTRGLASYGSVSSLPTSSVSSRPIARHHDKRRSHAIDDRIKKAKDVKSINKRFQRLESHVVTLARSVAHLSSEMRTQHIMIQEMENIRGEIAALRTQTNMAMVRSQSQPVIKDSELPALSNPSRVKKLTKFFGTEPPLIRLFLRELGYEKYAGAFEKERVGMVELPYLSEERLQKMGVPLGPRLRILQEARISVCKDPVYVV